MQSEDEPFADRSKYCSLPAASGGYTKLSKPLRCAAKRYASCSSCLKADRPMLPQASLKAVVDELETLTDQRHAYLNNRTGETVSISDEEINIVENGEPLNGIHDWQREIVDIARSQSTGWRRMTFRTSTTTSDPSTESMSASLQSNTYAGL
ncbi:MAG: hypothetical protein A2X67_13065 [Ignavibacteria bacterium GWA2_55_11]|nr:MAG: hypothetical protein A2X67_13065 [Ignavibacteria bacterium GWA2_55_11]OGU47389.1 MAG: hypothetical protein A2X68_12320 [Ignavibacteria bacterium GWC2_56_12]